MLSGPHPLTIWSFSFLTAQLNQSASQKMLDIDAAPRLFGFEMICVCAIMSPSNLRARSHRYVYSYTIGLSAVHRSSGFALVVALYRAW